MSEELINIIKKQKKLFKSQKTTDKRFQDFYLKRLRLNIKKDIKEIHLALNKDLGKSFDESFYSETSRVFQIINECLKNSPKVKDNHLIFKPYGTCLIVLPYTLPFFSAISEIIYAIASGNTVIVLSNKKSKHTTNILKRIIDITFNISHVYLIDNYVDLSEYYKHFDFIRILDSSYIIENNLSSKVLINGPAYGTALIEKNCDIKNAVNRLVFKKSIDWGQTNNAPDYILVEESILDIFISEYITEIESQIGSDPIIDDEFGHIIDNENYSRLVNIINENTVIYGGAKNEQLLKIGPHIIKLNYEKSIYFTDILGPITFIIPFSNISNALHLLNNNRGDSLYVFSKTKRFPELIVNNTTYKNYYINDTIVNVDIEKEIRKYQYEVNILY